MDVLTPEPALLVAGRTRRTSRTRRLAQAARAVGDHLWTGLILLGHWNLVAWPPPAGSADQEQRSAGPR
jgi:hypothetical protein